MLAKERIQQMEQEKLSRTSKADKMVMRELLQMGFSYNYTGTHHLHDCIVASINEDLRNYRSMDALLQSANKKVCEMYGISFRQRARSVEVAIEKAFDTGNIAYLLEVFKGVYDYDKQKVSGREFVATIRQKLIAEIGELENTQELKISIKEMVDGIFDISMLSNICGILTALKGGAA